MSEKEQFKPVDITTDTGSDMLFDFAPEEPVPTAIPLEEPTDSVSHTYERLGPSNEEVEQQDSERESAFYDTGYTRVTTNSIPARPAPIRNYNTPAANKAREETMKVYAQINNLTGPIEPTKLPEEFHTLSTDTHDAVDKRRRQQGISDNQVAALRRVEELRKKQRSK